MNMMKGFVNGITAFRLFAALALHIPQPFSPAFWLLYCLCGVSDIADGFFARKLHQQSEFGAKLDSIADAAFFLSAAVVFARAIPIPFWLWLCIACALTLRLVSYGVGFVRHRCFVSVHTCTNKAAGVLLFFSPLLFGLFGLTAAEIIVSVAAILSSAEELAITASCAEPQRDRKCLLRR